MLDRPAAAVAAAAGDGPFDAVAREKSDDEDYTQDWDDARRRPSRLLMTRCSSTRSWWARDDDGNKFVAESEGKVVGAIAIDATAETAVAGDLLKRALSSERLWIAVGFVVDAVDDGDKRLLKWKVQKLSSRSSWKF